VGTWSERVGSLGWTTCSLSDGFCDDGYQVVVAEEGRSEDRARQD